jgi:hypothetical protein
VLERLGRQGNACCLELRFEVLVKGGSFFGGHILHDGLELLVTLLVNVFHLRVQRGALFGRRASVILMRGGEPLQALISFLVI